MKNWIVLVFVCAFGSHTAAQFDSDIQSSAWERTSYEHWDEFNPWWYFMFIHAKYDDEDRRTMPTRGKQMALWSIYRDDFNFYSKRVDSLFEAETYKALDKKLNKNWLLTQKGRAERIFEDTESALQAAIETLPNELYERVLEESELLRTNMDIVLDSYVPDSKKTPVLESYMNSLEKLKDLIAMLTRMYSKLELLNGEIPAINIELMFNE